MAELSSMHALTEKPRDGIRDLSAEGAQVRPGNSITCRCQMQFDEHGFVWYQWVTYGQICQEFRSGYDLSGE